jgi:Cu+-exporting ATPase
VLCGTRRLFLERGVSNAEHEPWAAGVEATGRRALFVGVDGRIAAMFAVEEEPVQGAEEVVRALALLGMEPALTTSAEADAARALGARIGVERVHFEVREPGIGEVLTGIEAAGDSAVLVGHGPAFEEAARGAKAAVALGGAGATLADVDMRDNALGHLVPLVAAARDARASVRWNAAGLGVALGAGVGLAATWPTPGAAVVVAALGALAGAACTFNRPYPLAARLLHGAAQRLERAWKAVLARSRRL